MAPKPRKSPGTESKAPRKRAPVKSAPSVKAVAPHVKAALPPPSKHLLKKLAAVAGVSVLVGASFLFGIFFSFRLPDTSRPLAASMINNLYLPAVRAVSALTTLTTAYPSAQDMRVNRITVSGDTTLPGTVLVAFRGGVGGYEDRLVEFNRRGEIVWEYRLPAAYRLAGAIERLPNGNTLFIRTVPAPDTSSFIDPEYPKWVVEVNRSGETVREFPAHVTHDLRTLSNGNILLVDAGRDQVSEVDAHGNEVWLWRAADYIFPYDETTFNGLDPRMVDNRAIMNMYAGYRAGWARSRWTHLNSAQRLENGHTLISLRNLDLIIDIDEQGRVSRTFGALLLKHPHCAEALPSGNLLVADNGNGRVAEFDWTSQKPTWEYGPLRFPTQGCATRLTNGDTFITESAALRVLQVTASGAIVWQARVSTPGTAAFYRAILIP